MKMSSKKLIGHRSRVTVSASTGLTASSKVTDELDRHSVVTSIESELECYIRNEKRKKESLLKKINDNKRSKVANGRYNKCLDTKTMKPVDWNHINEKDESVCNDAKNTWAEDKSIEGYKQQKSVEEDKPDNLSFIDISFSADKSPNQLSHFDPD